MYTIAIFRQEMFISVYIYHQWKLHIFSAKGILLLYFKIRKKYMPHLICTFFFFFFFFFLFCRYCGKKFGKMILNDSEIEQKMFMGLYPQHGWEWKRVCSSASRRLKMVEQSKIAGVCRELNDGWQAEWALSMKGL